MEICTSFFSAELFTIFKIWKQFQDPLNVEEMKKMTGTHMYIDECNSGQEKCHYL